MPRLQDIVVFALMLAALWCAAWLWRRDVFRPGSLERLAGAGRLRNPAPINPGLWLCAGVATFLAAIIGAGIAGSVLRAGAAPGGAPDPAAAALMDVATYLLAGTVGVLCAGLLARGGKALGAEPDRLGLECRGGDFLRGTGGLLVVLPICVTAGVAASLAAKLLHEDTPRLGHAGLREMVANRHAWHAWLKGAMAVIGAPVMEELVYRVFVQSAIISGLARLRAARAGVPAHLAAANPSDVFWGIALSTVGFVLPHAAALNGPASWNALPSLTVLGIGLGVVYERTRSPLAAITMHAGFNAVNLAVAMATAGGAEG